MKMSGEGGKNPKGKGKSSRGSTSGNGLAQLKRAAKVDPRLSAGFRSPRMPVAPDRSSEAGPIKGC